MKKITRKIISDGITQAVHLSLNPGATVNDAHALLKAIAGPTESLAQEVVRRAAELDGQAAGLAISVQVVVRQCIDEARSMEAVGGYTPAQVREPLVRAGWLIYQGSAAPLVAKAKAQSAAQSDRRKGTGSDHEAVRRFHARLVANDVNDPTSQTAVEFGLTTRQVRNIVNPPNSNRK